MRSILHPLTVSISTKRVGRRVLNPPHVWVYFRCDGRDDIARVRDLSVGGVFIETKKPKKIGAITNLHFLVQDGVIRADATVRHAREGQGMGLKFTAVREEDRKNLISLVSRLRAV
jgi:c-di-GMP-binding flagellar brake protein YcgR